MAKITSISPKGLQLIADFEGYRNRAYLDSAGIWTIGHGTTRYPSGPKKGQRVKKGDTCTKEQALQWLLEDSKWAAKAADDYTRDDINQNQFDALASFIYNVGPTAYRNSTLRVKINSGASEAGIRQQFARWNKAGGKVIKGLSNRRAREAALYFS